MSQTWTVTPELEQRLGCGILAAVLLPLWFGVLALGATDSSLAALVAVALFAVAVVVALLALRRTRRLPRLVELDDGGTLRLLSRSGVTVSAAADIQAVELTTSLGMHPLVLRLAGGRTLRLPRYLDDLDGFLNALRAHNPRLTVVDRNP